MNLYFLYDAASRFAALDTGAAQQVIRTLTESMQSCTAAHAGSGAQGESAEVICRVGTPPDVELWLGAFAEHQDVTVVSLAAEAPDESLHARIRALTRAHKRPTLGGLSLEERPADIQESVRALLDELGWRQRALLHGASLHPLMAAEEGASRAVHLRRHSLLARQLSRSARRWRTTQARRDFKDVLQEASTAPQLVERDGQEVFIIDRALLERFEQPLSGAALAARFASNQLSPLKFTEEMASEPEPEIRLGARS